MAPNTTSIDESAAQGCPGLAALDTRLKALRSAQKAWEPQFQRRRFWMYGAGALVLLAWLTFVFVSVWRVHGPPILLKDGWFHVSDHRWGFEMDLPGWYSTTTDWDKVHYQSRFPSSHTTIDIFVEKWQPQMNSPTPFLALRNAIKDAETYGKVKVLLDQTDSATPMIDYTFAAAQWGDSFANRHRLIIRQGIKLQIVIHGTNYVPEEEQQRMLESLRWLR